MGNRILSIKLFLILVFNCKKMKKVFYLIPLALVVCACDCLESPIESYIRVENAEAVGIHAASNSKYKDQLDRGLLPVAEFCTRWTEPNKMNGPELIKLWKKIFGDNFNYVLWLDAEHNIVARWDLSAELEDGEPRWLDPSQWVVDSSTCIVCSNDLQVHYYNTFTFDSTDLIR